MKKIIAIVAMLLTAGGYAGYQPADWNLQARKEFAGFKFGIFIHWGLYANYAQGEWYLQSGKLDEPTYARMMYGFYPSKFDAREWVRVFKDAGAKYVTITSRHHDGFSLWPTKADDGYNIALTPFKRDILGELAEACKAEGLQLNFYYSLMDWHRKDYPAGSTSGVVLGEQKGDYASYKKFMMAQITELIDRYHPGNIWFDGEWDHMERGPNNEHLRREDTGKGLDWEFDDIFDLIHSKKTLVANNNHATIRPKEDLQLFERDLPGVNTTGFSGGQAVDVSRPLEQCDVIQNNVWGYKIGEKNFRTAEEIATMIVKAAGNNANLLMNIGPNGAGELPATAIAEMARVGEWMRTNGEYIYDTVPGKVQDSHTVSLSKGGRTFVFNLVQGKFPELVLK